MVRRSAKKPMISLASTDGACIMYQKYDKDLQGTLISDLIKRKSCIDVDPNALEKVTTLLFTSCVTS